MDENAFRNYLHLLQELCGTLKTLTEIEQEKTRAVRGDDLAELNECMKKEQALTLALRGYDQKRETALTALGLAGTPLSQLTARAPESCRAEARDTVEDLRLQYSLFRGAAEVARDTLECNLHQIEGVLQKMEANGAEHAGYQKEDPKIPPTLGTDFRA